MTDASNEASQRYGNQLNFKLQDPSQEIQKERINILSTVNNSNQQNTQQANSTDFVLYWMSASQRVEYNHAFEYAVKKANFYQLPLLVMFCLIGGYPGASHRHYAFMLQGLKQLHRRVRSRNSYLICIHGQAKDVITQICLTCRPKFLIFDRSYLKTPRDWRDNIRQILVHKQNIAEIESDATVPIEVASQQSVDSAASYRRKIVRSIEDFLVPLISTQLEIPILGETIDQIYDNYLQQSQFELSSFIDLEKVEVEQILDIVQTDSSVKEVQKLKGGYLEAERLLNIFLDKKLQLYGDRDSRYNVIDEACSHLSPYFHYGQISALYVAIRVLQQPPFLNPSKGRFLDELIIRRELCFNHVWYHRDNYQSFDVLPGWGQTSLLQHAGDQRQYVYRMEELENGLTHDKYWNAAQLEMVRDGKMHNYLRMYWAKKILEWTHSPQEAIRIAIYLNDKYELDGRGAGGYVGVLWSIGGLHDRPFPDRQIFGQIRYMNANGLKSKLKGLEDFCDRYGTNKGKRQSGGESKNIADMFKKAKKQ